MLERATRTATLLYCAAAAGCAAAETEPAPAARTRPHDFTVMSVLTRRDANGPRPDYVLVRVEAGQPHAEGGLPQPAIETKLLTAGEEGSTLYRVAGDTVSIVARGEGTAAVQEAVVAGRVEFGPDVDVMSIPRQSFPTGHEDVEAQETLVPAAPPGVDAARTGPPSRSYRTEVHMDHAGDDSVDLTFAFDVRADEVVVRQVPTTTLRVRFGESVLFPTRKP